MKNNLNSLIDDCNEDQSLYDLLRLRISGFCLDTKLTDRVRAIIPSFNMQAFNTFAVKSTSATPEQLSVMRAFLDQIGLTFDDDEWNEFLRHRAMQMLLMESLIPGVTQSKTPAFLGPFFRVKECIATLLATPLPIPDTTYPQEEDDNTSEVSSVLHTLEPTTETLAAVESLLSGSTIDWSSIQPSERENVVSAIRHYLSRAGDGPLVWHDDTQIRFIPYNPTKGTGMHPPRYIIQETRNGHTFQFDALYLNKNGFRVSPLPTELLSNIGLVETFTEEIEDAS